MTQENGHGKCNKCNKTHTSEAEKLEHAKTCGTNEAVSPADVKEPKAVPEAAVVST